MLDSSTETQTKYIVERLIVQKLHGKTLEHWHVNYVGCDEDTMLRELDLRRAQSPKIQYRAVVEIRHRTIHPW